MLDTALPSEPHVIRSDFRHRKYVGSAATGLASGGMTRKASPAGGPGSARSKVTFVALLWSCEALSDSGEMTRKASPPWTGSVTRLPGVGSTDGSGEPGTAGLAVF